MMFFDFQTERNGPMKKAFRILSLVLALATLFTLCACGRRRDTGYRVIGELDQEEFRVAFRKDDPLCDIVTAAMEEIAAEGQLSRLCGQYLGVDYSCLPAIQGALEVLRMDIQPGRKLRIGVQDGIAPLCSVRDDGSYAGLIPDMTQLVADKLGWEFEYMPINSENVAAELGSGNIDMAWMAASFAGTEKTCSLSPGWLENSHELVVRTASKYTRKSSLKGRIIGVTDATSVDALRTAEMLKTGEDDKKAGKKAGAIWYYDDMSTCFNALAAGDCDAVVIDSIVANYYM